MENNDTTPSNANGTGGDGGVERAMTWEEYRKKYVEEQRRRFRLHQQGINRNDGEGGAISETNASAQASSLPLQQPTPQPNAPEQQQQQQQREEEEEGAGQPVPQLVRAALRRGLTHFLNEETVIQGLRVVGRAALASVLVFRSFSVYNVFVMLGIYMGWCLLKFMFSSVRVEGSSERKRNQGRESVQPEGINPEGTKPQAAQAVQRVTPVRKLLYVITRCATSFVLSISPTYSVEQLEAELVADGIVDPHLHVD
ncbi:hypothetical protein, conserved [Trypanosoma brucei gambiense DAL972]|uniref:Uncharacterized protein n=1 Tax=Trypanosoma brucei gambiense (strain MHOM/CI/86/DAL972) TaxID=679716 RepID=C9ZNV7_TRYB9|nr:hypothetical protein, conserved [Trypanosoma brucei gambiense DAL972]CBH11085.1 hypothetical protein, conserved [Trypanosoma brucei gambiense DAL972]|eukprot:XP_011773372.1 hypothetical protein, conserved [Trypanosoma brucei gambiense DAL972]